MPWPVHNDKYTNQANYAAYNVVFVRGCFIYLPSPQDGHDNKYPSVCSVNSAKVSGLKSWDYSVEYQYYSTQHTDQDVLAFPKPEPYKVSSSNLA